MLDMPVTQPVGALRTVQSGTFIDMTLSPDGQRVYTVSGNTVSGNTVSTVDIATGAIVQHYSFGTSLGAVSLAASGNSLLVVERSPTSGTQVVYRLQPTTGDVTTFTTTAPAGSDGGFFDVSYLADGRAILSQVTPGASVPLVVLDTLTGNFSTTTQTIGDRSTLTASASQTSVLVQPSSIFFNLYLYSAVGGVVAQATGLYDPYAGAGLPPASSGVQAISASGDLIAQGTTQYVFNSNLTPQLSLATDYSYLTARSFAFSPSGDRLYMLVGGSDIHVVASNTATYDVVGYYPVAPPRARGPRKRRAMAISCKRRRMAATSRC
ncbi:MAG: hypothetical protein K2Y20_00160 [Sphingomonas sp.]|nr:hypothetical protein [Sphingomonas sp.]